MCWVYAIIGLVALLIIAKLVLNAFGLELIGKDIDTASAEYCWSEVDKLTSRIQAFLEVHLHGKKVDVSSVPFHFQMGSMTRLLGACKRLLELEGPTDKLTQSIKQVDVLWGSLLWIMVAMCRYGAQAEQAVKAEYAGSVETKLQLHEQLISQLKDKASTDEWVEWSADVHSFKLATLREEAERLAPRTQGED